MTAWPVETVERLCSRVTSGGTPSRSRPEYFTPDEHLWVKSKELLDRSVSSTEELISTAGLRGSSAKPIRPNSVLMAMYGANVGQLGWLTVPATVNQAICAMETDPDQVDGRWLFFSLMHWRPALIAKAHGAAQQNLNQGLIRGFGLPTPPLPVQRKIAAVLAAYDELIENNLRRIEILEEMAQAVYREWFVNFRFPGHEDVALVDSLLGPIPEGWKVGTLGAIASVNDESIRPKDAPPEIGYIDISSVSPGSINAVASMRFEDAPSRARRVVHHGDTIWSTVRPNRRSFAVVLNPAENTIVSTGFAVLRPRAVPWVFLHLATSTMEFSAYLSNHARGAAYPAVNAEDFENARLVIPTEVLLDEFAPLVDPMFELRESLRRQNANLRATRDLLLPKLVSGEIDVSELDIEAEWLVA